MIRQVRGVFAWGLTLGLVLCGSDGFAAGLTLAQAERVAADRFAAVTAAAAEAQSLQELAVAEGQLPDPRLTVGVVNVPTDSFDLQGEDMTQVMVGVQQTFPPPGQRAQTRARTRSLSEAQGWREQELRLKAVQGVRRAWLEAHYQYRARLFVLESQETFAQLAKITRLQYQSGKGSQQDVVTAELELSLLKDREVAIGAAHQVALAELVNWLDGMEVPSDVAAEFPVIPTLPTNDVLLAHLTDHPAYRVMAAEVQAAEQGVAVAQSAYRPGWMVDVNYGYRAGGRGDMLSAVASVDLPIFPAQRQDRSVAVGRQAVAVARAALDGRRRELTRMLAERTAQWERSGLRADIYSSDVLPKVVQLALSSLKAYQSGVSNFEVVMRARLKELEYRLDALRLQVDRAEAQVDLLYLAGSGAS